MKFAPYQVLIVDDEPSVRDVTVRNFTRSGFICALAEDGEVAADLLKKNTYDAVITDIRMPNRNGHSLASELLEQLPRPVVVAVTGILEPRIARDLIIRGIDRVDYKPVDHYKLACQVKAMIDQQRARNVAVETTIKDDSKTTIKDDSKRLLAGSDAGKEQNSLAELPSRFTNNPIAPE